MSEDCKYIYAIVNIKILCLYRVKDAALIAEFPLYSKPEHIACSSEFIALTMADRKIVSFLICDPLRADNSTRIERLERKKVCHDEADKTLKDKIYKRAIDASTGGGCRPEIIFKHLLNHPTTELAQIDLPPKELDVEKFKKNVHEAKTITLFEKDLTISELKPNWQMDLLKES